jgi:hypothetical protein
MYIFTCFLEGAGDAWLEGEAGWFVAEGVDLPCWLANARKLLNDYPQTYSVNLAGKWIERVDLDTEDVSEKKPFWMNVPIDPDNYFCDEAYLSIGQNSFCITVHDEEGTEIFYGFFDLKYLDMEEAE